MHMRFPFFHDAKYSQYIQKNTPKLDEAAEALSRSSWAGWTDISVSAPEAAVQEMEAWASEIARDADCFVVIGIGGSHQGARGTIDALRVGRQTAILYAGVNLSAAYMQDILDALEGKSVYVNVIAKNFQTMEPGVTFRFLRHYMEKRYRPEEASRRIFATLTPGDGELEAIADKKGYRKLVFPHDIGGRYSVFSPVGLFPIAVAGGDIRAFLQGARDAQKASVDALAREYALYRNFHFERGYTVEALSFFEPRLYELGKWWRQLFAESEGKMDTGIFPALLSNTEDLHSLGQYMQQGKPQIMETFLHIAQSGEELPVPPEETLEDGYDFLNGKTLNEINETAYQGTLQAHADRGLPCAVMEMEKADAREIGEWMYFCLRACVYSCALRGVDPFDQPGVESYKRVMNTLLGRC